MNAEKRPFATIQDVAKHAGVSITTVSFVLNDNPKQSISDVVRKRVLSAARVLDYSPRASAVGLAGKRTRNLGIVLHKDAVAVSDPLVARMVEGAAMEAAHWRYNLLVWLQEATYKRPSDLPKMVRERNVEGVLLLRAVSTAMGRAVKARGVAVVAVDSEPSVRGLETLDIDARQAGSLAAKHLFELGHRSVGIVAARPEQPSEKARVEGFRRACERLGVALSDEAAATALYCTDDRLAADVLRRAREAGRRIPDDLSVIGFGDLELAEHLDPPLTTIRADGAELGKRAVERLVEMIDGESGRGTKACQGSVSVELIVRKSTARAPSLTRPPLR